MANFAELVGIVIANAESRAQLTASRARIVAAGDEARRRIERDLHDGAQQRLVSTVVALKLARRELGDARRPARSSWWTRRSAHAEQRARSCASSRTAILPAGAHPWRAARRGSRRSPPRRPLPGRRSRSPTERAAAGVEATAYFIVAEALTNVVKHARAGGARSNVASRAACCAVEVRDDGVGGAQSDGSSGLLGLRDRAAALDGELRSREPSRRGDGGRCEAPHPRRASGVTPRTASWMRPSARSCRFRRSPFVL